MQFLRVSFSVSCMSDFLSGKCCGLGNPGVAKHSVADQDVITLSTVASAHEKCLQWRAALGLLPGLKRGGLEATVILYNTLGAAARGRWSSVLCLLAELLHQGLQPTAVSLNSALSADVSAASLSSWRQGLVLLRCLTGVRRTAVTCGAAVGAVAGGWRWGAQVLVDFRVAGVPGSARAYGAAIASSKEWQQILLLLELLDGEFGANVIAYNAAISACEKGKKWEQALGLLRRLKLAKLQATIVSYGAAISACEKGRQWKLALQLLAELGEVRLQGNLVVHNAALSACEKCQQWERALVLLHKGHRSTVTCNAGISACPWQPALALFARFEEESLQRTAVTCGAAISACEARHWHLALALAAAWVGETSLIARNAAISACQKGGRWRRALRLFGLLSHAAQPSVVSFNAAVSAAGARGASWQKALRLLAALDSSLRPTAVTACAAVEACAAGVQWRSALRLLRSHRPHLASCTAAAVACERHPPQLQRLVAELDALLKRFFRGHARNTCSCG